ncbi:hypothetical protein [Engelhardtia mirabilis]|uniref:Uncharacterized protein n=1 Tax=Engelhardtia mirabilis TaxID=2528011 RepID=A0A518BJ02_9BACT|nr:hypothetical protein Pla133_20330 [Planctomycetes bacterium Pla133]QDV01285.1 hypothetical protein Pla86_20340 [Planctomycetes bacterium Pla86]
MSASTRPIECERRPAGRGARGRMLGVAAPLALLAFTGGAQDSGGGTRIEFDLHGEFVFDVDLTEDFYHRYRAGLFVPESEPLVMRATTLDDDGDVIMAGGKYLRFTWDQGTFDVRIDRNGLVVLHMDDQAAMSHLTTVLPPTVSSMAREFPEYPNHPIQ